MSDIHLNVNVTCGNLRDISQGVNRTTIVLKCRIQRYICKIKFKNVKGLDNRIQKFAVHFSTTWRNKYLSPFPPITGRKSQSCVQICNAHAKLTFSDVKIINNNCLEVSDRAI